MIEGTLALHDDYNEVVEEIISHLLSFSPVPEGSRYDAPPFFHGRNFPAHCVYETGDSEEPKGSQNSILPGVIDFHIDFVYPSVGTLAKKDGIASATLETRKVYSDFRKALYSSEAMRASMDGRVRFISLVSSDSGDFDAFGNPRGAELRTESILWVRRAITRVYL